jgi:hypothetical protein
LPTWSSWYRAWRQVKNPTEQGVEYLVPFVDALTGKLIVACVQCKFVQRTANWKSVRSKLKRAVSYFKQHQIEWFPVVYTSVDRGSLKPETSAKGVYFIEKDIFRFTNRLGILRLHCAKLGEHLAKKYSFDF